MSGNISKRQQARNERALQELIKTVPGNSTCADCGARNPGWASWSLGIFLCMRCAALHRKLGTHISKVKSLSMDAWSNEQVEYMKSIGNTLSNRKYNPSNTKPPIPVDADEADSVMERFIRQKYTKKEAGSGQRLADSRVPDGRRISNSSDDNPPPLPPKKESSRFGFRSASSIFPMSSKSKREAAARQHLEDEARTRELSKMSRDYNRAGRENGPDSLGDLDSKLETLREMGFRDDKKNKTILQGLNGHLEKSIETLVRLGGGNTPASGTRTPVNESGGGGEPSSAGLTVNRTREAASVGPSNNPWESRAAPIQSAQSTGNVVSNNPFERIASPTNPFGLQPSQSQTALNQQYQLADQFQNMSVSQQQQQPLFPHNTGGQPARQTYQPPFAPPLPSIPQEWAYDQQAPQAQSYNPFQQQAQTQAPLQYQNSGNPFITQTRSATFPLQLQQQGMYNQTAPQQPTSPFEQNAQSNPFQMQQQQPSQTQQQSNPFGYQSQLTQPQSQQPNNTYSQPQQQHQPQQQQPANPWASQNQQAVNQQQQYNQLQYQAQPQQLKPQQTGRAGKSDIMALFNEPYQPAYAPPPQQQQQQPQSDMSSIASSFAHNQNQQPQSQPQQSQQQSQYMGGLLPQNDSSRNMSSPFAPSTNPFMSPPPGAPNTMSNMTGSAPTGSMNGQIPHGAKHTSQESMSVGAGAWGVQNGRHSPDAFASLSARSFR